MKPCKAKLSDGKPCPNQADEGQEYCPYHLSNQVSKAKNIFSILATIFGVFIAGIFATLKFVIGSKR